jgi:hypothetical protein
MVKVGRENSEAGKDLAPFYRLRESRTKVSCRVAVIVGNEVRPNTAVVTCEIGVLSVRDEREPRLRRTNTMSWRLALPPPILHFQLLHQSHLISRHITLIIYTKVTMLTVAPANTLEQRIYDLLRPFRDECFGEIVDAADDSTVARSTIKLERKVLVLARTSISYTPITLHLLNSTQRTSLSSHTITSPTSRPPSTLLISSPSCAAGQVTA